jgi:DNA-binding IclR family transcriptional regulator
MMHLDIVLESLHDSQWHSLDELAALFSLPEDKLKKIIRLLEEEGFISFEEERGRVKIKPLGLTFLELPPE